MCSIDDGFACDLSAVFTKTDFEEEQWIAIKARTGLKIKRICANHRLSYCTFYERKQNQCCDPFRERRHTSRPVKTQLRTIDVDMFLKSRAVLQFRQRLVPGQKLCRPCSTEVNKLLNLVEDPGEPLSSASSTCGSQDTDTAVPEREADTAGTCEPSSAPGSQDMFAEEDSESKGGGAIVPGSSVDDASQRKYVSSFGRVISMKNKLDESLTSSQGSVGSDASFDPNPGSSALEKINKSLQAIGASPVMKRKLSAPTYAPSKLKKIGDEFESLMSASAGTSVSTDSDFEPKLIEALKQKMSTCNTADKILALSVPLTVYSQRKCLDIFKHHGATDWLVRKTHQLMEQQDGLFPVPVSKKGRSLPAEIHQLVINFYESDESSRQLPGKKDFVSLRVNGERVQVQKRLVLCNLKELYAFFKTEHPHVPLSFSKFAALRPRHCVLAGAAGTHSICVCKHHQNFKLMLDGAKFSDLEVNLVTYKDFMKNVTCDPPANDCYLKPFCPKCPGIEPLKEKLLDVLSENFVEEISYEQWTSTDRSTLETKIQKSPDFVETLVSTLSDLLPHHFISKAQSKSLAQLKENLDESTVIAICDFSENYSFVVQDSVQGFYWTNDQATIFPIVCYHLVDGKVQPLSFTIISDHMKHSTVAVYSFLKKLMAFLKEKVPQVKKIICFSDGAASQFKNCYMLQILTHFKEDFDVDCEWHYFGTSHGKGPSDGLGGQWKRRASRASLQGQLIRSPKELYDWAAKQDSATTVTFVSTEEVLECRDFLKPRVYKVLPVPGIRDQIHCAVPLSIGELMCKRTSSLEQSFFAPVEIVRKVPALESVDGGDFVTVLGQSWKVAQVILKDEENQDLIVNFLEKKGNNRFTISHQESEEIISFSNVITVVNLKFIETENSYELSKHDLSKTTWQFKIMTGKKFAQPEQIRKGTWE